MLSRLRHLLIGPPLPTQQLAYERLNKIRALAAFSPDALSSIAYANQGIYLGLLIAGGAGLLLAWPVGLAITGLLVVVDADYDATVTTFEGEEHSVPWSGPGREALIQAIMEVSHR